MCVYAVYREEMAGANKESLEGPLKYEVCKFSQVKEVRGKLSCERTGGEVERSKCKP